MSLFKRLFGSQKSSRYGTFPSLPVVPLELPKSPRRSVSLGKYTLEEKLAKLTQVRPQREAILWQGTARGECTFYAFVKTNEENRKWLVERLGGGEVLEDALWEEIQSLKVLLGMSRQLSCLAFKFTLDARYRMEYRLYADESEEVWVASDKERRQQVLLTALKPQGDSKFPEDFHGRQFADFEPASFPGFLPVCGEGQCKTVGLFAAHRYRFPRMLYAVTEIPPSLVPASWLLSQRQISLDEAIGILYQVGRILASLHEKGWCHGHVTPQHLFLAPGSDDPNVYLDGFSLMRLQGETGSFSNAEKGPTDAGHDQYLLALTVYKLASGKIPSGGQKITPLHEVCPRFPAWFSGILSRMLSPVLQERFRSLREMIVALTQELKDPEGAEGEEIVSGGSRKHEPPPEKKNAVPDPASPKITRAIPAQDKGAGAKKNALSSGEAPEKNKAGCDSPEKDASESFLQSASEEWTEEDFEEFAASPLVLDSYLLCYPYQPFLLNPDRMFCIGRGKDNDLILSSEDVSSSHAIISWENDSYRLKDQGSSNGTSVNGKPVHEHILTHGDKVTIGANTIVYREIAQGRLPEDADQKLLLKKTLRIPSLRKGKAEVYTSLSGDLSQISLWQVVQMLAGEEKTGALVIVREGEEMKFFFLQGTVVHCEAGDDKGHEVFYREVLRQQGRFEFNPDMAPREITMSDTVESLLLETARRLDEQERRH